MFYGQRPSVWWTLRHDIDLLIGTHKYGYANYSVMRADRKLSFYETEQVECQFNEFPYADNITRRLKKLVQIFGKSEFQLNLCFEHPIDGPEPTYFTRVEKEIICDLLSDYGLPILSGDSGNKVDYKSDFQFIRTKMLERMKEIK